MKVVDLGGREVPWKIQGCRVLGDETRPRSGLHLRAREVIKSAFPHDQVYEEVPIPGSRMRCDFWVPAALVMVEVQGEQHFEFTPFHHGTRAKFRRAVALDREKSRFCDINQFRLVALRYDDTDEAWGRVLREG